jgi:hypothetical protein
MKQIFRKLKSIATNQSRGDLMGFKRKYLSADGLIRVVRQALDKERFKPCRRSAYTWQDCIMSCLAVFGFKFPSLLQFEKAKGDEAWLRRNLRTLYGVTHAPSDTCMRERLDQLTPAQLRRPFKRIFACLQRGKVLEQFAYFGGHYIVSLDGTGQYASKKVHCQNCCEKKHRNGAITYYHHMVGAAIVHPDHKAVIPLAPEPIVKGDGANKNDCERNASRRLLQDLRREHPHLKALIVEDGLASNFPHLSLLDSLNMPYIIGVKPGDHGYLFDWIGMMEGETHQYTDSKGTLHAFHYYHDVPLSDAHDDYRVNVLRYWETKPTGRQQQFSWVTSLPLSSATVTEIMRAGRAGVLKMKRLIP